MKYFRQVIAALAVCAAFPAAATTTNTYSFTNAPSAVTNTSSTYQTTAANGTTTFLTNSTSEYGDNGTNYGNTLSWGTGANKVTASAWANTNNGKFEAAYIGNYSGDLGITSQTTSTNNTELDSSHAPNTGDSEHAIDSKGAYEAMVFSFASAVTLADVSIGFPQTPSSLDTDSTILYYAGSGNPTVGANGLAARTLTDLMANGWKVATNLGNMSTGLNATNLSNSASSQYWLVGGYMGAAISGTTQVGVGTIVGGADSTPDYFKINGLKATITSSVPEPSSIALFGIAGAAWLVGRRRRRAKAV